MNEQIFKEKYTFLVENISNTKYYHLKSINNFIAHLNEFGSMQNRIKVEEILNEYFDFVSSKEQISREEGKYIYYSFIKPLGRIYSYNLKFFILLDPFTAFLIFLLLLILLFFTNASIYAYIICITIAVLIYFPFHLKKRANKVYGFDF